MKKILIIGDIILDHYIVGSVNRISPEAPVPVLDYEKEFYRLGGAANVAANIEAFCDPELKPYHDQDVTLLGVGGFKFFKEWTHLIKDRKFYVKMDLNNESFLRKTRYSANNHYLLRVDEGTKYSESFKNLSLVEEEVKAADIIIISDYCKGTITDELLPIFNRYKSTKIFIVDSKSTKKNLFFGSYLITPNTVELKAILGNRLGILDIERFMEGYRIKHLLHTKGHEGMDLYTLEEGELEWKHYDAINEQQVIDVTGAGDTVVATIAGGLAIGLSLNLAIEVANAAASEVVSKFGTSTIRG